MTRKYGKTPRDCGHFINPNPEMMFWMYCPISLPGMDEVILPPNLANYQLMVDWATRREHGWKDQYVYLTAKTLFVSPGSMGNRPGWHTDGFGTDDINYIWSDECPTEFLTSSSGFDLSTDDRESMRQMDEIAASGEAMIQRYPKGHILRLDPYVVHRVPESDFTGYRSFAKLTFSEHKFDLAGNSVNHRLNSRGWSYRPRRTERNMESGK